MDASLAFMSPFSAAARPRRYQVLASTLIHFQACSTAFRTPRGLLRFGKLLNSHLQSMERNRFSISLRCSVLLLFSCLRWRAGLDARRPYMFDQRTFKEGHIIKWRTAATATQGVRDTQRVAPYDGTADAAVI